MQPLAEEMEPLERKVLQVQPVLSLAVEVRADTAPEETTATEEMVQPDKYASRMPHHLVLHPAKRPLM